MVFWLITFCLGLWVALILWRAGFRSTAAPDQAPDTEVSVYRDQMAEIDRDLARGVLEAEEADRARAEVGRRLLALDRRARADTPRGSGTLFVGGAAVLTAVGAGVLYMGIGAPGYGDLPLRDRIETAAERAASRPPQTEFAAPDAEPDALADAPGADIVARLREAMKERPEDVNGLRLLARSETSLGRLNAAIAAQRALLDIAGPDAAADDHLFLAELLLTQSTGLVTQEAEAALRATLERDPDRPEARYGLGLMYLQIGRPDVAFRFWNPLLAEGPETAPWIGPIRRDITAVAQAAGIPRYEQPRARGPSSADVAAAEELSAEDRATMIEGMVAGLANRLASDGGPVEDWAQLIRAQSVLGRTDQAQAIYDEAKGVFAERPDAIQLLAQTADQAGLIP